MPAGSYRLRSWHPRLPPGTLALDQALQMPATGSVQVTMKIAGLAP